LGNQPQNVGEEVFGDRDFRYLERDAAALTDDFRADAGRSAPELRRLPAERQR
jgi:hypothetical protein